MSVFGFNSAWWMLVGNYGINKWSEWNLEVSVQY